MKRILIENDAWFYVVNYETNTYKMFMGFEGMRDSKYRNNSCANTMSHSTFAKQQRFKVLAEYAGKLTDKKLKELLPEYFI